MKDILYEQGLKYAQHAEWGKAITCFKQSIQQNPESPAAESLTMVQDILDYYYKDNLNP